MKNFILLGLVCLVAQIISAQKIVEKHMSFSGKQSVSFNIQIADSIKIVTWNKDEVYVKASINVDDNKYNDNYTMTFDESGSLLKVNAKLDLNKDRYKSDKNCCCCKSDIYCEVYLPENAEFSVESINANLIIVGKTAHINAKTISGFIDLSLQPGKKADLNLKTISGTIYSNLALNETGGKSFPVHVSSQINGGGDPIKLETISGDIYLRQVNK